MKIAIVGAGQVGAATAVQVVEKSLAEEVMLVDVVEGMPQGKALDLYESTPVVGRDVKVTGSNKFEDIKGAGIVVVTAGFPRKPGMSRMDLLKANIDIIKPVAQAIKTSAPDSKVIIVTNPLDIMTYVAHVILGFPHHRVVGMAGILDTARFRTFLSMETGFSVGDIQAMVLGGHGDAMVPLPRFATVGGIPLSNFIAEERLKQIIQRTRDGGAEIVKLLKTGSAYYAPGAAVAQMIEAMVRDRKRVLPCCAYLEGQYGYKDVCVGVPVVLGKNGVEKVVQLDLNAEEKAGLEKSTKELVETIAELKKNAML